MIEASRVDKLSVLTEALSTRRGELIQVDTIHKNVEDFGDLRIEIGNGDERIQIAKVQCHTLKPVLGTAGYSLGIA